jgi:ribonucleoside-diphosphate reductase alpha chain
MPNYNNFQSDNQKHSKDRSDIYNPEFESPVANFSSTSFIDDNIHKWAELISFWRFYPDYFYDIISDKKSKFKFDTDQRVYIRCLARFHTNYVCVTRGYSKTLIQVMYLYAVACLYPGVKLSFIAETKESSVNIWEDKHDEIVGFFPYIQSCIKTESFQKDRAKVVFVNGSEVDSMGVRQGVKGQRRHRGHGEEDNLITKKTMDDAVIPVFDIARNAGGVEPDPEEFNGYINRFTTSGFRNSDAFANLKVAYEDMKNLKGGCVYTSDWTLMCYFGRQTRKRVESRRESMSLTEFKQNYLCSWLGNDNDALINISKLMEVRQNKTLELQYNEIKYKKKESLPEYIIGVDISRKAHNRTAIIVGKISKSKNNRISKIDIVNMIMPPYNLPYKEQAVWIKRVFYKYGGSTDIIHSRVKAIVVDANSWGRGTIEELIKVHIDPTNSDVLESLGTINTDDIPEDKNAPEIIYAVEATGKNNPDIIMSFVNYFEEKKVRLFTEINSIKRKMTIQEREDCEILSMQTSEFINEVANLKLVDKTNQKNLQIEQVRKSTDKDRYSAMAYMFYYIKMFLDIPDRKDDVDWSAYVGGRNDGVPNYY